MGNIFKLDDIKAGYLLVVEDTETGNELNMTVVPTTEYDPNPFSRIILDHKPRKSGDLACCCRGEHWWPVSAFDGKLTANERYRVLAVYGYTAPKFLLDNSTEDRELLWEREPAEETAEKNEPETKKMTMDEIAKALGYPVEIVEG